MDKVKINSDPVSTIYGEYVPEKITDSKVALKASLHMILKHTADMFLTIIDIIAEKYGHDSDEMMKLVIDHPKYSDMFVNPIIHDLGYNISSQDTAAAAAPVKEEVPATTAATATAAPEKPKRVMSEEAKRKAAEKRAATKLAKAAATAAVETPTPEPVQELQQEPQQEPQQQKVVKTFKIKPKVVAPPPLPQPNET